MRRISLLKQVTWRGKFEPKLLPNRVLQRLRQAKRLFGIIVDTSGPSKYILLSKVFSPRKKNSLMIIVMWPRQPVTFFAGLLRYRVRRKKQHSKLLQHYKSGSQIQHGSLCIPQRFYMLTVQKYLSRKRGQIIQKCQTNIMLG